MKVQSKISLLFILFGVKDVLGQRNLRKGVEENSKAGIVEHDSLRKVNSRKKLLEEPSSWPDCITKTVHDCESLINSTVTNSVNFQLIDSSNGDVLFTMDYDPDRVRIFHDGSSPPLVTEPTPMRG